MANKAISELPQAQNVNNQDLFVLEQSGIAKKLPAETFITEQGIIDALAEALDGHGGIQSVTLASVSGRIRTYLITFTDGTTTTFQVLDGNTIDRITKTSTAGLVDTYTVFMSDGTTTFFTVTNGADGTVSEAMLNDALKDKAPAITETTESSAIANFTDGADDMPLHNILAEINPVQDLTYGDPYPAGGGKNKLPPSNAGTASNNGMTCVSDGNGSYTLSGTATADSTIKYALPVPYTIVSGNYLHMMNPTANSNVGILLDFADGSSAYPTFSSASRIFDLASRVGQTITAIGFTVINGNAYSGTITPMVVNSATPTSFAPYSNICPITGWTGVNVTRTGKNLYNREDSEYNVPVYATDGTASSYPDVGVVYVPVLPNTKYSVTLQPNSFSYYFRWIECDKNKGFVYRASGTYASYTDSSRVMYFTTQSNTAYLQVAVNQYGSGDIQRNNWEIQIEKGDATAYEPYQGETVTVDWQTEAGTVYGGTIDVATGLLTVTWVSVDLGTLNFSFWNRNSNRDCFSTSIPIRNRTSSSENIPALSSIFTPTNYNATWKTWDMSYINANNKVVFITPHELYANETEFKTAMSGVQFVYELATPQTYQLTPQEVKTLLGTNNVWADTGNVSVTYPADTKMFIEKLTMPTEDDLVANQAITSGKYFMVGNSLYLALANIASGAQITIGTNAQRVSLADALNTINS